MADAIAVEGVRKRFGDVESLAGVDLRVAPGTVFGLLGPNGAGKTTLVRILATLLRPDAGRVLVGGYDVVREPARVRRVVGMSGQFAALDDRLTGTENLLLFGRLSRLGRRAVRRRVAELVDRLDLGEVASRPAGTYSGGQRRRFDIAVGLVSEPAVLFLDEPTTGLDVRARQSVWDMVRGLVAEGTTVLLTTHYLEEADRLADVVAVLNRGRVVAGGSPAELKSRLDTHHVELTVTDPARMARTTEIVRRYTGEQHPPLRDDGTAVLLPLRDGDAGLVPRLLADLYAADVPVDRLVVRPPTLDDLVLSLTEPAPPVPGPSTGRRTTVGAAVSTDRPESGGTPPPAREAP